MRRSKGTATELITRACSINHSMITHANVSHRSAAMQFKCDYGSLERHKETSAGNLYLWATASGNARYALYAILINNFLVERDDDQCNWLESIACISCVSVNILYRVVRLNLFYPAELKNHDYSENQKIICKYIIKWTLKCCCIVSLILINIIVRVDRITCARAFRALAASTLWFQLVVVGLCRICKLYVCNGKL